MSDKINVPDRFRTENKTDKVETKAETKETKETKESKPSESQPLVIKTEIDAYINELMSSQPSTINDVEVRDFKFDKPASLVALPPDVEAIMKKNGYVPRWINKTKKWVDHAVYRRGWVIVNRVLFPELRKHHFTANGTIENGDCILGFMSEAQAEKLRRAPREESNEKIKNLPIEKYNESTGGEKIGYYKPAYTAEPDGQVERKGIGLYAQPDLPSENE